MKVRSLKQVLHWIFLVVGIFSLIMLGITVDTYLGYAEEGYGLKMNFDRATLNENWLILEFYIENPGGLDIELTRGNLTLSKTYEISHITAEELPELELLSPLPAGENISVIFRIPISHPDLGNIQMYHEADILLDLELWVPDRLMSTHITFQASVEVII